MAAGTAQQAPAQEAGRPQPQTTAQPQGGPFVRHSQSGRARQYNLTGQAFGFNINQPLTAVPGYVRAFRLRITATGGSASASFTPNADAPFNCVALLQAYDAFGTPLLVGGGYEQLYVVPKYSGQFFSGGMEPKALTTWSGVATASGASAGNFTLPTVLPIEVVKGIGVISMANAALLPKIQLSGNTGATVYGTASPGTAPTMAVRLDTDYYWLPDAPVAPPGLGTTCQWIQNVGNPTIGSGATQAVTLPREGGYLTAIVPIMRDSTGARIDGYGTQIQFYVDGVPLIDTDFATLQDDIAIAYAFQTANLTGGFTRDTGLLPITRRTGLGREIFGLLDTGEEWLSTSPGTSIAIQCAPWGTVSNAPAVLNVVAGQVVAAGSLVTGLPEV